MHRVLTRREILRATAGTAAGLAGAPLLAACGGTTGATTASSAAVPTSGAAPAGVVSALVAASASTATSAVTAGSASSVPSTTTAGPALTTTAASVAKAATQVEFWTNPGYAYTGHVGAQFVQEFQQATPGVTVNFEDNAIGNSSHAVKLTAAAAAGTVPDLSYLDRFNTKSFACHGIIAPLDGYMNRAKNARLDLFWPRLQYDIGFKGKPWAVPHGPVVGLLFYNTDLFQAAGLDPAKPPSTWQEALTMIPRLVKGSGSGTTQVGWAPARGFGVPWMVPYWQLGAELTSPDETRAIFDNDQAMQVFSWFLQADDLQGGEAAIDAAYQKVNAFDAFAQSKVAMVWAAQSQYAISWAKVPNLHVGFGYWPTPPNGSRSNYMGGWSLVVPQGAKHPEAAFAFLDYISADDPQIRWANEWNTIPTTQSAAGAAAFLQGRPDRKLAVADMPTAKWVITAPGGDKALAPTQNVASDIIAKRLNIRDSLAAAQKEAQQDLDDAGKNCGA